MTPREEKVLKDLYGKVHMLIQDMSSRHRLSESSKSMTGVSISSASLIGLHHISGVLDSLLEMKDKE